MTFSVCQLCSANTKHEVCWNCQKYAAQTLRNPDRIVWRFHRGIKVPIIYSGKADAPVCDNRSGPGSAAVTADNSQGLADNTSRSVD